ncbi:hypothetical protein CC80DRAFT_501020 [Byssothecium circinans]|uniref:Transmembrane protein n=1 Tax=Byssothecium circinans TaxID=147558 RepID=A0A6A5U6I1_9PLEO|nr:hypothetical protein CC80DRAFT_501020 [Byssothecium circinans]
MTSQQQHRRVNFQRLQYLFRNTRTVHPSNPHQAAIADSNPRNRANAMAILSPSTGTMQVILAGLIVVFAMLVGYILIVDTSDPRNPRSLHRERGAKWHTRGVSVMSTISERSEGRSRRASRRESFVSSILSSAAGSGSERGVGGGAGAGSAVAGAEVKWNERKEKRKGGRRRQR